MLESKEKNLIFFYREDDCNVDVRDVINGESLPYRRFINKYVCKVEPHRAILEPDYFIKLIESAEQKRDEEVKSFLSYSLDWENWIRPRFWGWGLKKLISREWMGKTLKPFKRRILDENSFTSSILGYESCWFGKTS